MGARDCVLAPIALRLLSRASSSLEKFKRRSKNGQKHQYEHVQ